MIRTMQRLIVDDTAQDLIEYGLLSGILGTVGLLLYPQIVDTISVAYSDWVADASDAWEPCPPASAICP